ncbi:MAG: hypothetical protein JOY99_08125 [Sphingomonadaceae bacterium]|nr:hypothetical protein [Sphingomonadaceae bacterium]
MNAKSHFITERPSRLPLHEPMPPVRTLDLAAPAEGARRLSLRRPAIALVIALVAGYLLSPASPLGPQVAWYALVGVMVFGFGGLLLDAGLRRSKD